MDFAMKTNPFGAPKKVEKKVDAATINARIVALDAIKSKAKEVRQRKCQKQPKDS
jgi:hypothetical protein